jgi:predicted DNA-binding transcriptional regulator YafY
MSESLLRRIIILQNLPEFPRTETTREILASIEYDGLSCSLRTIQRDLEYLSGCGLFGITHSKESYPVGWYWVKGGRNNIAFMDRSTAVAFVLMKSLVPKHLPSSVLNKLTTYFDQAEILLNKHEGWTKKLQFIGTQQPLSDSLELGNNSNLDVICAALDTGCCLSMSIGRYYQGLTLSYLNYDPIHPLGLLATAENIYLVHFKGTHKKPRVVSINLLKNVKNSTERLCKEAREFDLNRYTKTVSLSQVFSKKKTHTMIVKENVARHLIHNPITVDQEITEPDGTGFYEVRFTADDTAVLRGRIKVLKSL